MAGSKSNNNTALTVNEPVTLERQRRVAAMWLQGMSVAEISHEIELSDHTVRDYIKRIRQELKVIHEGDMQDLSNEAVQRLRSMASYGHNLLNSDGFPDGAKAGVMGVIVRTIELEAKLQGLLSSERQIDLEALRQQMRMYDFVDNTPPANAVDGEFREVSEGENNG